MVYIYTTYKLFSMTRQSITLAKQNDEWLKNQVAQEEFNSKSEAINYLIKQARERDDYTEFVRMKLIKAEKSGFSNKTKEELLAEIKKKLNV
jgi:antitoxin ParD1/3/4